MVISVGGEPAHFTLDPSLGEFVLTSPKLAVPDAGKIYSVNEGNASLWDAAVAKCVRPAERRPLPFLRIGCVSQAMAFCAGTSPSASTHQTAASQRVRAMWVSAPACSIPNTPTTLAASCR